MLTAKSVTDAEWTFEIVNGPSKLELVTVAIGKILEADKGIVEVSFKLKPHFYKWLGENIRSRIKMISKVGKDQWIIIGDWLDAKFEDRPCSFRATYSSSSKKGGLVFSLKYGQLSIATIDYIFDYVSFGQNLSGQE